MKLSPQQQLVFLSAILFFPITLLAQLDQGLVALEKADYSTAYTILTNQAESKKTAVVGHFGLAKLYASAESSHYNLKKANDHGKTCNELLREVKNKVYKEELKAIGISSKPLREIRKQISEQAIAKALQTNTPEALEDVLRSFRLTPDQKEGLKVAYGESVVQKIGATSDPKQADALLQSYQRQLNRYNSTAIAAGDSVVFEKYLAQNSWAEFEAFKTEFPNNRFAKDNGAAAFLRIRNSMDIGTFENFTQKYRYSAFVTMAKDSIAEFRRMLAGNKEKIVIGLDTLSDYQGLAAFGKAYQSHLSQRIFHKENHQLEQKLFAAFINEKGWNSFPEFKENHPRNRFVLDQAAKAYITIAETEQLGKFEAFVVKHPNSHYKAFAEIEIDRLTKLRKELADQAKIASEQFKTPKDLYGFQEKNRADYVKYAPLLNEKMDRQVLDGYLASKGFDHFDQFQKDFPNNAFSSDEAAEAFLEIAGSGKLSAFESFAKDHTRSHFREIAIDSIRFWKNYRSEFNQEVKKALQAVDSYKEAIALNEKYQKKIIQYAPALQEDVDKKLLSSYVESTGGKGLDEFEKKHPNNSGWNEVEVKNFEEILGSNDLSRYRQFNSRYPNSVFKKIVRDSIQNIESKLKPEEKVTFADLQRRIRGDLQRKNWNDALQKIRSAGSGYTDDPEWYDELLALVKEPEQGIIRKEISKKINSLGSAYLPNVTTDSKTLYFCATGFPGNKGREDIFMSKKIGEEWGDPQLIDELCTAEKHEAPLSASADGNTLLLFLGGKIGYSEKTSKGWSEPKFYSSNINQGSWQCDAIISADGKAMFFTYGDGGWSRNNDIYLALKQKNGTWGKAKKLNSTINTSKDERSPFLHPDMKTLYFSSTGHGGIGGLDVYVSTRLDDTWDNWSEPRNLGKEVNTVDEDWGYKISTDGKKAYFAADLSGSNKLFEVNLPAEFRPDQVVTIEGKVEGLAKLESASIIVIDSKTQEEITRITTEPGTGEYFIVVPKGVEPEVKVEKEGVFSTATKIDINTVGTEKEETSAVVQNLEVVDFNQQEVEELTLSFEDVLFETDQYVIREELKKSLDELAGILAKKDLKINISGYTDDVGAAEYNQALSQKRAEAVKVYLVEKGCNPEKITAIGYGESNPIAPNDTEAGQAKNRRVEFSFEQ